MKHRDQVNFSSVHANQMRLLRPMLLPRGIGVDCVKVISEFWGDDPFAVDAATEKRAHRLTVAFSAITHWALYLIGFVSSFFHSNRVYHRYLLLCVSLVAVYGLSLLAMAVANKCPPRRLWRFARTGVVMLGPTLLAAVIFFVFESVLAAQAYQFAVFYILGHAVFFDITWQKDQVKQFCFRSATNQFQTGHCGKSDLSALSTIDLISSVALYQYDEYNLLIEFRLPFYYQEFCIARLTPDLWDQLSSLDWSRSPIARDMKSLMSTKPRTWRGTVPLGVISMSAQDEV